MTCANCLSVAVESIAKVPKRSRFPVAALVQLISAVVVAWVLFYFFAQTLTDIPDEFHDGTIWE